LDVNRSFAIQSPYQTTKYLGTEFEGNFNGKTREHLKYFMHCQKLFFIRSLCRFQIFFETPGNGSEKTFWKVALYDLYGL